MTRLSVPEFFSLHIPIIFGWVGRGSKGYLAWRWGAVFIFLFLLDLFLERHCCVIVEMVYTWMRKTRLDC